MKLKILIGTVLLTTTLSFAASPEVISPTEAERLARLFLEGKKERIEISPKAVLYKNTCNLLIESKKGLRDQTLKGCYFVHYLKGPKQEWDFDGEPLIVVSLDGRTIGISPLE